MSPSVVSAATALAEWARVRRHAWSDVPLHIPAKVVAPPPAPIAQMIAPVVDTIEQVVPVKETFVPDAASFEVVEPVAFEEPAAPFEEPAALFEEPAALFEEPVAPFHGHVTLFDEPPAVVEEPLRNERTKAFGRRLRELFIAAGELLEPLRESAVSWLMRGAAFASVLAIVMVIGINRGLLFERWDKVSGMVVAAANRPLAPAPAPVAPPAAGSGRVTITSTTGSALVFVDGTVRGQAPVTLDLTAGPHRVLVRSDSGSVERTIRVQAAETAEVDESIFPGWVALTAQVDVSLSEGGHLLKRDERGWAILPPGPHDIHLDNNALGVHEVRHVVVTPGDTTRVSFAPQTSTISLTANELSDVWIDGKPYGQAPLVDQPIGLGVHDVRVRSAAHERWLRVRATVQPLTINVDLTAAN